MSQSQQAETITLDELKRLANSNKPIKKAARPALTIAERLTKEGRLGSILLSRELRSINVFEAA